MQTELIEKLNFDQQVDVYDLAAATEKPQAPYSRIGIRKTASKGAGTDGNRQLISPKDWFYSALSRQLTTEFYRKNGIPLSKKLEETFSHLLRESSKVEKVILCERKEKLAGALVGSIPTEEKLKENLDNYLKIALTNSASGNDQKVGVLSAEQIRYFIHTMRHSESGEDSPGGSLKKLHEDCIFTAKMLTREMVEGSTPICFQIDIKYQNSTSRDDVLRLLHRCLKLHQTREDAKRVLSLMLKLEHDPSAETRPIQETIQLLNRVRIAVSNFLSEHHLYHKLFMYADENLVTYIKHRLVEIPDAEISAKVKHKVDR